METILKRAVALRFLFCGAEETVDLPATPAVASRTSAARTSAAGSTEVVSAAAAVSGAAAVEWRLNQEKRQLEALWHLLELFPRGVCWQMRSKSLRRRRKRL